MAASHPFNRHRRIDIVVALTLFLDMVMYSIVIPILPAQAKLYGAEEGMVGLLFAMYALTLSIAAPFCGRLADTIGRRIPTIAGLVLLILGTLMYAVAENYWLLFAARALQGMAAAATWSAGLALAADVHPPNERGGVLGALFSVASFGFLIGPLLGAWLYELGGYSFPFYALIAALLLNLFAWLFIIREPRREIQHSPSLRPLMRDRRGFSLLVMVCGGTAMIAMVEPTLPLFVTEVFNATPGEIAWLFAVLSICTTIVNPLAGKLSDRLDRKRIILIGAIGSIVIYPLIALESSLVVSGVVMALFGIAFAMFFAPTLPALTDIADVHNIGYAGAFAAFNVAYAAGTWIGPLIGGYLMQWFSFSWGLNVMALVAALCAVYYVTSARTRTSAQGD